MGERLLREFRRPVPGQAVEWGILAHPARDTDLCGRILGPARGEPDPSKPALPSDPRSAAMPLSRVSGGRSSPSGQAAPRIRLTLQAKARPLRCGLDTPGSMRVPNSWHQYHSRLPRLSKCDQPAQQLWGSLLPGHRFVRALRPDITGGASRLKVGPAKHEGCLHKAMALDKFSRYSAPRGCFRSHAGITTLIRAFATGDRMSAEESSRRLRHLRNESGRAAREMSEMTGIPNGDA